MAAGTGSSRVLGAFMALMCAGLAVAKTVAGSGEEAAGAPVPLYSKLLGVMCTPVHKVLDVYATTPVASYMSLPGFVVAFFGSIFALWALSRMADPKPYLYNNGKLGYLEKKSVYVDPHTGEHIKPE